MLVQTLAKKKKTKKNSELKKYFKKAIAIQNKCNS